MAVLCNQSRGEREEKQTNFARSSNGRTAVSGTAYRGSSPCRAANRNAQLMIRYIQMWLMMRTLQDQEEHFTTEDKRSFLLEKGVRASVGVDKFAAFCSSKSLAYAFLPSGMRKLLRPKKVSEYTNQKPNAQKLRSIFSLIKIAKHEGYIEHGIKRGEDGVLRPQEDRIRISPAGDDFCSYFGGLESLIKKYPSMWGLVGLSVLPWLYSTISSAFFK